MSQWGLVPTINGRLVMASVCAVLGVGNREVPLDVSAARYALNIAWISYKQSTIRHYREGIDFGRVCYEWRAKYRAQGSHNGKGFDHLLESIGIPKTTAYRWIRHYEMRGGLRAKRNEVEGSCQNYDDSVRPGKVTSFRFFLSSERRKQFEDDTSSRT